MQYAYSAVIFCGKPALGFFFFVFEISGVNVVMRWLEAEFAPLRPLVLLYNLATAQKSCIYLSQITSEVLNVQIPRACSLNDYYYAKLRAVIKKDFCRFVVEIREHSLCRCSVTLTLVLFFLMSVICKTRKEYSPLDVTIYLLLLFCTQRISVSAVHFYNDSFK